VITASNPAGNPTQEAGTPRPFSVTATDPDGDILTYTWRVDGQARGGNSSAFDLSGAGPGTYTVNVTVSDGQLADWHEWTVTVTPASPNWAWVAVPILAAVLVVIFVLWRRRRKREATPAST